MEKMSNVRKVGYKFLPSGEELMIHLIHHVRAELEALDGGEIVKEVELYGETSDPWTVLEESRQRDGCWYVITKLKKVSPGKSRNKRSAGSGTWNARQTHTVTLHYGGVTYKGSHRYLVFLEDPKKKKKKQQDPHDGHWVMDEYSLKNPHDHQDDQDYAICKIRNKAAPKVTCKRSYPEDLDHILNLGSKKMRIEQGDGLVDDDWLIRCLEDDHYLEKLLPRDVIPTTTTQVEDLVVAGEGDQGDMRSNNTYTSQDEAVNEVGDDYSWDIDQIISSYHSRSNNTTTQHEAASLPLNTTTPQVDDDDYSWIFDQISYDCEDDEQVHDHMRTNNTTQHEPVNGMSMPPQLDDYTWMVEPISN